MSEGISDGQRVRQIDVPRRVQRMRDASQEDALVATRHFFASGNRQGQVVSLGIPEEVSTTTASGIPLEISPPAITSTVPTTSTTITTTRAGTGSPRSFLPNGSSSSPTATATCRPQTWVQRVLEGWTHISPLMVLKQERVVYMTHPY